MKNTAYQSPYSFYWIGFTSYTKYANTILNESDISTRLYWVGQKVRSVFECYLSGLLKIVL